MSKSNILPFDYNGHSLSTITDDQGEIWFIAKEVAVILDYSDAEAMTRKLDDDEKQNLQIVGFGNRGVTTINESGLYSAILGSTKPEAKPFKKWVTSEVLPSIRKTGKYIAAVVSKAQLGEMSARIADRFPVAKDKPYAWSRFNNHFRLASYKDLPAEKYEEALAYIDQMPVKQQAVAVNTEKAPKKISPPVISDYLQIHINRKTHEVALGQYEAIRLIITEAVQSNLNCGAAEAEAHDLIEAYGDGASNIIVMNRRDVFMLASQTTHLLNTAGEALETIHRLEKHLGRNLYQRKQHGERGHFGLPESLVESVLNAVQEREAA